jgi:glycosyltransferase involved in cell wall biosynthesis
MSGLPLVSVVMPVYNAEKFLHQAIQSIFAQTVSDWELIAVPRIRLARNDKNMKQAFTQNRGIEMARGKYIARMDADDISFPERIEKQLQALESNKEIDVLGCGSISIFENFEPFLVCRPVVTYKEIVRIASMNFPLLHGGLVGKTEWFKKWQANPKMKFAQDFDLLFRAHKESVFGNVPEPLYIGRFVGGTTPVSRKIESVYYKALSLWQNGFKMGLYKETIIGLASMAPRPLLYLIKAAIGKNEIGLIKSQGIRPSEDDRKMLLKALAEIEKTEVPLKKSN